MRYTIFTKVTIFSVDGEAGIDVRKVRFERYGIRFIIKGKEDSYRKRQDLEIFLPYDKVDYIEVRK